MAACTGWISNPAYSEQPQTINSQINDISALRGVTPILFLEILKTRQAPIISFKEPIKGWVRKEHLAELIALSRSQVPCSSVKLLVSSYADLRNSTVGQEAVFMILGFKKGEYPPKLNSIRFDMADDDLQRENDEIVQWAKQELEKK